MLPDAALRNLKPKSKIYKASGRDGMCVRVSPSGTVTFRYDYRLHGRRETLTLGCYGQGGISLAMARGVAIKTFGAAMEAWLANARLADSTRAMHKPMTESVITVDPGFNA